MDISWLPFLVVLPAMLAVQIAPHRALGCPRLIGDEVDFVACGARSDPSVSALFVRVPLMGWLSELANRSSRSPEHFLRLATSAASALSILICMVTAQICAGPSAALMVGMVMTLMPGRVLLSRHIWPDLWLGLWLALTCFLLVLPGLPPDLRALALGLVATLAFVTRFDALLLAPSAGLAMAPESAGQWLLIVLPALICFAGLSLRNARRYGVPWPDNSWMFNLMLAAAEQRGQQIKPVLVQRNVGQMAKIWQPLSQPERFSRAAVALRGLLARPLDALPGLLSRLWSMMGQDSFSLHRLLPPGGGAYPDLAPRFGQVLRVALKLEFPLFTAATVLALLVGGLPLPGLAWTTLALAAGSLIHHRTRYRQAWLPGAALLLAAASAAPGFWVALGRAENLWAWAISVILGLALLRFPVRPDRKSA